MSATNCDTCTGLACGDECDGKSHATKLSQIDAAKIAFIKFLNAPVDFESA